MARQPACIAIACPLCGAQPGEPCQRIRPGTLRAEPIRPHQDRRDALYEQNREQGVIR